jgi:hypothetical protein
MRTTYSSHASLNILRLQSLFELFVARLHFRLPDFEFAQLDAQISRDFLTAGLRKCTYCQERNE